MQMIIMVLDAIGGVFCSLMLAALLCWLLWDAFRLLRHPAWSAWAVLIVGAAVVATGATTSEVLLMALAFASVGAAPLWMAGRAWRKERLEQPKNALVVSGQR